MNWVKRFWFYYGCLSRLERIVIEAKEPQDKEKRDQLILDIVRENKLEGRPTVLSKCWWMWGMILTISLFSWALLKNYIRENTEGGVLESIFPFFIIVGASYLLGAAFRDFWLNDFSSCRKHDTRLVCPKCQEELMAKLKKLDREMKERGVGKVPKVK
ncbi:MAG: hypothetical protein GTO24_15340 [candidate division Zixibacteria bacterium]|nr:hypothetical protein [candidate division Zixibacteria bacterium]